jgi:hypothetical protein|tara:strand:+ start:290 stop:559 length:270 start_codon:yes stop_codon:yes gene_type:complete
MIYEVIIKSHCEAPDYEDSIEAESKDEAIKKLLQKSSLRHWGYKDLEPFVGTDEEVSKKNVKKVVETHFKQLSHLNKLMRKHYGKKKCV